MSEQQRIKEILDQELNHLKFNRQVQVIRRTHPKSYADWIRHYWNKEIEVPVIPAAFALLLFITFTSGARLIDQFSIGTSSHIASERELVDTGAGIYWRDMLQKGEQEANEGKTKG